jgi:hypothetical protein
MLDTLPVNWPKYYCGLNCFWKNKKTSSWSVSHNRQSNIVTHLYFNIKKFHYTDKLWEKTPVKLSDRKELFIVHNERYRHLAHITKNTSFWKKMHIPHFDVPSMPLWHNSYRRIAAIRCYVHMHIIMILLD